jgi:hypothetical protein
LHYRLSEEKDGTLIQLQHGGFSDSRRPSQGVVGGWKKISERVQKHAEAVAGESCTAVEIRGARK